MKKNTKISILRPNHIGPGMIAKKSKGGNQPPKNKIVVRPLIRSILAYSPKKKRAKPKAEYSTL